MSTIHQYRYDDYTVAWAQLTLRRISEPFCCTHMLTYVRDADTCFEVLGHLDLTTLPTKDVLFIVPISAIRTNIEDRANLCVSQATHYYHAVHARTFLQHLFRYLGL
jgi:hypothetical protein